MKIGGSSFGSGKSKPHKYSEGRAPTKPAHGTGHYTEGVKLSRDNRLTPEGNYKETPRQLSKGLISTSGAGLSRVVSKNGPKTYGP